MARLKKVLWFILPITFSIMLGSIVIANALDWSNQDFFITDQNGNQVHWFSGSPITLWNVTVTTTEVVFAPTEFSEFRHWEFFDVRRTFDVTLDFINGSRADYTLFSGSGGSNAANVELHVDGTILDGFEINGSPGLLLFTFDDPFCVINPPTGNILDCIGTNIMDIGSVSGGLDLVVFMNNTRHVPPIALEAVINVNAELQGSNSILVSWELPLNGNPEKYIIERSDNSGQFIQRFETDRQDENRVINRETGRQIYWQLDQGLLPGNYQYQVASVQQNQQVFALPTDQIVVRDQSANTLVAEGNLIETAPSGPQPPLLLGFFKWFLPDIFAQSPSPIFTTSLNPDNESWLLALTPIPNPSYSLDNCNQVIEILHQIDQNGGQDIDITITVIESGVPRIQGTIGTSDSTKRLFARDVFIPFPDQTIQNYTDLQIQLDFIVENTPDHRAMSIWEVNFYVPEDNGAC